MEHQNHDDLVGTRLLQKHIDECSPIVAFLGQGAGWSSSSPDPVLQIALDRAGRVGSAWRDLLARDSLAADFYSWLDERFGRRIPSVSLDTIGDAPFSAVFTSSVDPGLIDLFATRGREPELVLIGNLKPKHQRSLRRPPVYYLFGRAGVGTADASAPVSVQAIAQRRIRHASAMLQSMEEAATPLGLILVDGFDPRSDWLRAEDLLASLVDAPAGGVLWLGDEPQFSEDDRAAYEDLRTAGIIVRDQRGLADILVDIQSKRGADWGSDWNEPELVSLAGDKSIVISPRLRLITEASATIVDDSWSGFLPPLGRDDEKLAFSSFHGLAGGVRLTFDGVRRDFAIDRDFEAKLHDTVSGALHRHHAQKGAIVLHGQSGVGKTIALTRLAHTMRKVGYAVLFARGRLPQPGDVFEFLKAVDKVGGVTLLIADSTTSAQKYDDLLHSLRSLGHHVVVIGSSYRLGFDVTKKNPRFIEAEAKLSDRERKNLGKLVERFEPDFVDSFNRVRNSPYTLARFYWVLPHSRSRLSTGLGDEARRAERDIHASGSSPPKPRPMGVLGQALIAAGYEPSLQPVFEDSDAHDIAGDAPAGRIIDFVMAASRLYINVPVNLLFRTVVSDRPESVGTVDPNLILDLINRQDLFRWSYAENEYSDVLVGARLQLEAQLICDRRLGGPEAEGRAIIQLIQAAHRAGPDDNEETQFVADIVFAIGPDGPGKERYKDCYADMARALTDLRVRSGVPNGRLMLQESTLRRAYVRTHRQLSQDDKWAILEEATEVVDTALRLIGEGGYRSIYASRRTEEHLWVERAATYGFVATEGARRGYDAAEVWSGYKAAREAVKAASARVDSYLPTDIALWMPTGILRASSSLSSLQKFEMQADVTATIDLVEPEFLPPAQRDAFNRQRMIFADVLGDSSLSDDAFEALDKAGSSVGFYLRARAMSPVRTEDELEVSQDDLAKARQAAAYLREHYRKVYTDDRCLHLLLRMEWMISTHRWLFQGARQPVPAQASDLRKIKGILIDIAAATPDGLSPKYRYLDAVMDWMVGNDKISTATWQKLQNDTEFVDVSRVINRHVITDEAFRPIVFSGILEKRLGGDRWSILVDQLSRHVDLAEQHFPHVDFALGRQIREFSIVFNYRGPLADPLTSRARQR